MADLRIQYDEEMVGAGHPTKDDTLNRLALVEADSDGHGLARWLKARADDPATAAGELALYSKEVGGAPELFARAASDGAVSQLTSGGVFNAAGPGHYKGLTAYYSGTTAVYIGKGELDIAGQVYVQDNAANVQIAGGSPVANTPYYVYATPSGSGVSWSADTEIPAWDSELGGWYNAAKSARCLPEAGWLVRTDASGEVRPFAIAGGYYQWHEPVAEFSQYGSVPTTFTTYTLTAPPALNIPLTVIIQIRGGEGSNANRFGVYLRAKHSVAGRDNTTIWVEGPPYYGAVNTGPLLTMNNNQIEWCCLYSNNKIDLSIRGFMLPRGER